MSVIDKDEAVRRIAGIARLARSDKQKALLGRCMYIIEHCPTVDAEPVRHAKWEYKCYPTIWYGPGEPPEWVCSECQDRAYDTYDYCPNCGARMDGGDE